MTFPGHFFTHFLPFLLYFLWHIQSRPFVFSYFIDPNHLLRQLSFSEFTLNTIENKRCFSIDIFNVWLFWNLFNYLYSYNFLISRFPRCSHSNFLSIPPRSAYQFPFLLSSDYQSAHTCIHTQAPIHTQAYCLFRYQSICITRSLLYFAPSFLLFIPSPHTVDTRPFCSFWDIFSALNWVEKT